MIPQWASVKAIPFKTHLLLDSVAGIAFVILPFVLGLDRVVSIYMIAMGAGVLLVVAVTQTREQQI